MLNLIQAKSQSATFLILFSKLLFAVVFSSALALNCNVPVNDKNGAQAKNWKDGKPVRVVRSWKGRKHSKYCPEEGNRYDGIYKVRLESITRLAVISQICIVVICLSL